MSETEHDPICPMADPTRRSLSCMCTWINAGRADERRKIGTWLALQARTARNSRNGKHPETVTRTQAAALYWAVSRILSGSQ